ncbi:hypothetical protein [Amycolatopsis sp. PS_44_ISF1]|uniref:hypothetical protein n=1 Tax=Amycolatopsis sp. PS_44_ISF1 TaxID=2974917 RepID=UPI0028DDED07|nr:hypothetical protein [Amycolatopsis sp. PS_44_ISF1]MDT8913749.1 hypothetical protein [Amycolatopsis sp. PS_44_ISF1]
MSVEAELTAVVREPEPVLVKLAERAEAVHSVYADNYHDRPGDDRRVVLAYKVPPADEESRSKPEHETTVADPDVMGTVFVGRGLVELISLEKYCDNYGSPLTAAARSPPS